jgi:Flp pilus assembly pilin Flp
VAGAVAAILSWRREGGAAERVQAFFETELDVSLTMVGAFLRDEDAQGLAEYALLLSLISLVSMIAVRRMGVDVRRTFRLARRGLR